MSSSVITGRGCAGKEHLAQNAGVFYSRSTHEARYDGISETIIGESEEENLIIRASRSAHQ